MNNQSVRPIAFYLPQFHPTPENDEFWGPGFTEWTNVASARPLYRGHLQPKLPGQLGFYDLRLHETRADQAMLAEEAGIEAFCYWHYWFAGRRVLNRPFNEVLAEGRPRMPFCLGWANQTWSGTWHGNPDQILIQQSYPGEADYVRHFRSLLSAFRDPRYFRVNGKPLFYVYRPADMPDPARYSEIWRTMADENGLEGLYLVGEAVGDWDADTTGFDAHVTPPLANLAYRSPMKRILSRIGRMPGSPRRYPYSALTAPPSQARLPFPALPCVMPNWDNTPRSGRAGYVVEGETPEAFEGHVRRACEAVSELPAQQRIVFVKSWNEWAEGNYLEPDRRTGEALLKALSRGLSSSGIHQTKYTTTKRGTGS